MDWHDRYALNPRPFGEDPTPFLREVFEDPSCYGVPDETLRILCPGDGYGRNGLWLARQGHSVIGLDLVPAAVGSALSSAIDGGADYLAVPADLSGSPFPLARGTTFEAIVTAWMRLPDSSARCAWNTECARRLEAGGAVVFVGSRRVTDSGVEQREWPSSIAWQDFSTEDEVRMVGHRLHRHRHAPTEPPHSAPRS